MRNFLAFLLLLSAVAILIRHSVGRQAVLSAEMIAKSRSALVEQLFCLDIPCLYMNEERLSDLGAGYDRDNHQYFLERPARPESFSDSCYLITIDFSAADNLLITVFAPEDACYQWLQIRARICNGKIVGRPVFQPDNCSGDLLEFGNSVPDRSFFQALLSPDN